MMIRQTLLLAIYGLLTLNLSAQNYPFENTNLSDDERLDNLISMMTLDEKVANLSSRPVGVPRLGVKGTRLMEGLHGLAYSGVANWGVKGPTASPTTTFPQSIGLAQTWDPELIREIASWEAEECRYLAQNPNYLSAGLIILSPNADLGRDIRWGRTEECYGEDAFLASRLTVAFVKGLQGDDLKYWKTASLMKHFLANSNENNRGINSSNFDDRLFREYYSYAFYKGITEGGSRAYMTAYNKYNEIPCIVNPVNKAISVNEWGQNGIICTDGGAFSMLVYSHKYYPDLVTAAAECIHAGITMFLDKYRDPLMQAIQQGLVTEKEIDKAVRGNLRVMLKLGLMDNYGDNPYAMIGIADTVKPWLKPCTKELVRKATVESVVLMKNENKLLPINKNKIKSIAVIGPSADLVVPDWYTGNPPYRVSILEGIKNVAGNDVTVIYAASNKADSAIIAAKNADVAIVCVGNHPINHNIKWGTSLVASDGMEAIDRQAISMEQEDLVKLVQSVNPNTVLVIVSSFPYAIGWSKEHVPAILHISQSSQELGNGLADVLFGAVSPAGRLVQTWLASIDELPPMLDYNIRNGRTYMYSKTEPLFAFGHGLTYTTFAYSGLSADKQILRTGDTLHLTFTLKNTGNFESDEVAQVYARFPDSKVERPNIALKAFQRVHMEIGRSKQVTISVPVSELMYWNVEANKFVLEKGNILFLIGPASNNLKLQIQISAE
jgi:beta-glucosidase